MEYLEAVKKVQAKKNKENFMVIETSYDTHVILPYKEGITFLSALNNAEQLRKPYGEVPRIISIKTDTFKNYILSSEEYEQYKIAALLNLTLEEVQEAALKAA